MGPIRALVLVGAATAIGCAPRPSQTDVSGLWKAKSGDMVVQFDKCGTFSTAPSSDSAPTTTGTSVVRGDRITLRVERTNSAAVPPSDPQEFVFRMGADYRSIGLQYTPEFLANHPKPPPSVFSTVANPDGPWLLARP